jgi:type I restriction enzyme R subunit
LMVARTGTRVPAGAKLAQRISALAGVGAILPNAQVTFDLVRVLGNRAVHEQFAGRAEAVQALRGCFELGVLLHRTLTGDRSPLPFVMPPPPGGASGDGLLHEILQAVRESQRQVEEQRQELTRLREFVEHEQPRRFSELVQQAQRRLDVPPDAMALATAVRRADAKVDLLERDFEQRQREHPRVRAADREAFLENVKVASREPLTEAETRREIDRMLAQAGWLVQDASAAMLPTVGGVALREVSTASGRADYLLYVDQKLVGVIEAKREGTILSPVEQQSGRYAETLTSSQQLAAWRTPLPFRYESTAVETHFTNTLDPVPRAREVFWFHRPETLARWMRQADEDGEAPSLRARLRTRMPPLDERGLRPAQIDSVQGLERSLAGDQPRSLIQMATGAGKTVAAVTAAYRLLRHARAQRILFLVDRNNLGEQAEKEFANYVTPDDGRKFTELYNVQRLSGVGLLDSSKVVICTIQRLYSLLCGEPLPDADIDDETLDSYERDSVAEVGYNPLIPPETFDLIVVDECHRSIYGQWRAVLEYFDAHLVGLTATPVAQTFGFFHQNLVSEYTYEQAVADGVNVGFDLFRIRTERGEHGGTIPAETVVPVRDRRTRRQRYQELDDDLDYTPAQLGTKVINEAQLRLVLRTFRQRWTEFFPNRAVLPKTLIFARDDNHAEEIVRVVREVFEAGNEFVAKITHKADRPRDRLQEFRNSPEMRVAVTVDMIATGTDVKPLEVVIFLRDVRSWSYFEQMKGRGARTIDDAEFRAVTPDADRKGHFLIVDPLGVTDNPLVDARPMQVHTEKQISLEQLLRKTGQLTISPEETSTLASRLARLNQQITDDDRAELEALAGMPLTRITRGLARLSDPDELDAARARGGDGIRDLVVEAVQPLAGNPELRARLLEVRRAYDIYYDQVNPDTLISAEGVAPEDRAMRVIASWRAYLNEHRDEIAAIDLAYRHGNGGHSAYRKLKELAERIQRPPHSWTPERLWDAYTQLGIAAARPGELDGVVDLIGLIRFELGADAEPRPHRSVIEEH